MKNEYGIPVAGLTRHDVKELEAYLVELTAKANVSASKFSVESDFADDFQHIENMLANCAADAQLTAFKHTLALLGWKMEGKRIVKRKYGRLNG